MTRWLAYSGSHPTLLHDILFASKHSLVFQSLHSSDDRTLTNGDGFGVGWYDQDSSNRSGSRSTMTTSTPSGIENEENRNENDQSTKMIINSNVATTTKVIRQHHQHHHQLQQQQQKHHHHHHHQDGPALYRSIEPAWHDRNMQDISHHIKSKLVFAHVRAATSSLSLSSSSSLSNKNNIIVPSVQQTNCHPFRYQQWLWMHNGYIHNFCPMKRDMMLQIDAQYFHCIEGTTDSEAFFYLALTFGLELDPPTAVAKAVEWILQYYHHHHHNNPATTHDTESTLLQMTLAITNGQHIWAFRYSSSDKHTSPTLYYSNANSNIIKGMSDSYDGSGEQKTPEKLDSCSTISIDNDGSHDQQQYSRFVVSEPLCDTPEMWNIVPESSCVLVHGLSVQITPFQPIHPIL
jgi:predicted glutamine amidotransferase